MIAAYSLSLRRLGTPLLLSLALGVAACGGDDAPPPVVNESEETVEEVLPPVEEPVNLPEPVENSIANTAAVNAVGLEPEEVPVDEQVLDDAATTGLTSRYTGDEANGEGAPAE